MITFVTTPPGREERAQARELAVLLQRELAPVARRIAAASRHGLAVRLASASSGAMLYLMEADRTAEPRAARQLSTNAAGCVTETATLLELLRQDGAIADADYHRIRIIAIRAVRALAPLAGPPYGDLRLTGPGWPRGAFPVAADAPGFAGAPALRHRRAS